MDEYTLLIAAKLQADRRRLQREQRATSPQQERPHDRNKAREYWHAPRSQLRRNLWREQS